MQHSNFKFRSKYGELENFEFYPGKCKPPWEWGILGLFRVGFVDLYDYVALPMTVWGSKHKISSFSRNRLRVRTIEKTNLKNTTAMKYKIKVTLINLFGAWQDMKSLVIVTEV